MRGFIIYQDYTEIDDQLYIQLFGRLENGQSFVTLNKLDPYFFIKTSELDKAKKLLVKFKVEKTNLRTFSGEELTKISSHNTPEMNKLGSAIRNLEIDTYESDIKPYYRFIIDHDLLGSIDIDGEYDSSEKVDRVYKNPTIKPSSFSPELKVISIDLESGEGGNLFCIGLYGHNYKKNFMITDQKLDNTVSCKTEAECLEKFRSEILKLDPDIITGWNIADFDFKYLQELFKKNKVQFDIGRTNSNIRVRSSDNFFRPSTVDIPGRQVLDGLSLIKDPFIQEAPSIKHADFDTYTLEDVAQAFLGEGKNIKGKGRHLKIENLYNSKKDHQELVDYNLQDCKLAYDILIKTKMLNLAIERSQLTGMPLDKITASIVAFDSLYIREARKRGLVSPSTEYGKKESKILGGYVKQPEPGIYHNVIVLDFKSLYPSIITTFNIDPANFIKKKEKGAIETPNGAYFRNTQGILPEIIKKLHEAREKAKKEKRELSSYALKIIMNCFSPDTEILTEKGIKKIEEIELGEKVYSIDPNNNKIGLYPVEKKFNYAYKGKMIRIKSKVVDYLVTPNHRFLVDLGKGYEWKEANELIKCKEFWLPPHSKINGKIIEEINLKDLCKKHNINYRINKDKLQKGPKHSSINSRYAIKDWLELLGWYISEGHIYTSKEKRYEDNKSWRGITKVVMINQKIKENRKKIEDLFSRMGIKYCRQFNGLSVNNHILAEILEKEAGIGSFNKRIPNWVLSLDASLLQIIFQSMMDGDGDKNGERYSTNCYSLAEDFLQLLHHIGIYGYICKDKSKYKTKNGEYEMYRVRVNKNRGILPYISPKRNMSTEDYEGNVLCIEVSPHHTILAGRNSRFNFCGQSFYGCLASQNSRYFDFDLASSITHFAQFIIKLTAKEIEKLGYKVIYSDTDSVFVSTGLDKQKSLVLGKEIEEKINTFYRNYTKEHYNRDSLLELQFEKLYLSIMFPSIRMKDDKEESKGARKRYAGLKIKDGKEELEVVGLEAIRGDWTEAAKEFQKELLLKVFHKEEVDKFIKTFVKKILEGKLDSQLVYRKSIRKNLDEYTKTTPPHVKAARQLDSLTSNVIEYYITTEGPEPIQKLRHKINYDHYIEKQIMPIANQVLFLFKKSFDDLIKSSKQTKLF